MQSNTQIQIPSALKYEYVMWPRNKKRDMKANFSITQLFAFPKLDSGKCYACKNFIFVV